MLPLLIDKKCATSAPKLIFNSCFELSEIECFILRKKNPHLEIRFFVAIFLGLYPFSLSLNYSPC